MDWRDSVCVVCVCAGAALRKCTTKCWLLRYGSRWRNCIIFGIMYGIAEQRQWKSSFLWLTITYRIALLQHWFLHNTWVNLLQSIWNGLECFLSFEPAMPIMDIRGNWAERQCHVAHTAIQLRWFLLLLRIEIIFLFSVSFVWILVNTILV